MEYHAPGSYSYRKETALMLTVRNLHKIYGKYHALSGLDMNVGDGALYGFVGPNGAGKTTTLKIMTGLLGAEEGSVTINGKDALRDLGELKGMIGYVPDFFGVYDNLTVAEYMSFFASCYQLDGLMARKRYTALLEQVGLEDKLDFYVDGLSRGMKQRLCLARALIHDPAILILDEPTSGLDPRTRFEFKEILSELRSTGKTIIISSHVLSELAEMCTDPQNHRVHIDQSRQTQNPVKKGKDQRKSGASGADLHLTAVNRILPHKTSPPFLLHDLSAA
jgi:ABC-2 type transport system ATP-binding protein